MKRTRFAWILLGAAAAQFSFAAERTGDAQRGARAFQQCAACHSVQPGQHLTGPSLAKVLGRKAGTAPGFLRYSDALRASNITWTPEALDRWIANPRAMVPGTAMTFAGIGDAQTRADIVVYLVAVSEGRAPTPSGGGGVMGGRMGGMMGGMMGGAEPDNLRHAGADSQIASIAHCHDTYEIRTRDGKTHRLWEYNVRLKTDSSDRGPAAGQPVMVASGMRGDRYSIVFAAPSDISRSIEERCAR